MEFTEVRKAPRPPSGSRVPYDGTETDTHHFKVTTKTYDSYPGRVYVDVSHSINGAAFNGHNFPAEDRSCLSAIIGEANANAFLASLEA